MSRVLFQSLLALAALVVGVPLLLAFGVAALLEPRGTSARG